MHRINLFSKIETSKVNKKKIKLGYTKKCMQHESVDHAPIVVKIGSLYDISQGILQVGEFSYYLLI